MPVTLSETLTGITLSESTGVNPLLTSPTLLTSPALLTSGGVPHSITLTITQPVTISITGTGA